jgi:outer membrane receptor protein involved in Fe transport
MAAAGMCQPEEKGGRQMTAQSRFHVYVYRKLGKWFGIGVLFLELAAGPAFPQLFTATILGVIKDTSGAVVPGATLTVRSPGTGLTRTSTSGADGSYRVPALPVGSYEIRVEQPGFQTALRTELVLTVGQEAVMNFSLTVGAIEQQVSVMAEAPLVNTTSGSLGNLINEEKIADLPLNGRNYVDLSLMQPGITQQKNVGTTAGMGGVWYSSNGAPPRSNSYLLDGASMLNLFGATASSVASTALGVEGIREYKVVTNSFSAEYGITMGSQMTMVSKSGTNSLHGSLFEYLRNSALDAANFFDSTPVISPGQRIAALHRNQFGASVGGPVKKDKTFFFVTYEGLREGAGQAQLLNVIPANCFNSATHAPLLTGNPCATASGGSVAPVSQPLLALYPYPNLPSVVPGAPANRFGWIFPQPTTENYGQARADHNFSIADSLFVRYTIDDTQTVRASGLYPQFRNPWQSRSQFGTVSENHIFTAALLNTVRFSFSRTNIVSDSISGISNATRPGTSFVCAPNYVPNCPEIGALAITGLTSFTPDISSPTDMKQNIFAFSDDVYYTRGRHSLKFGALLNHYQQSIFQLFQFKGGLTFLNVPNLMAGVVNQFNLEDPAHSNENKYWIYNSLGFYAQDDLRLGKNFTLNVGLCYEFITVPSEDHGNSSAMRHPNTTDTPASAVIGAPFHNSSLLNFSPRLGFAWDLFGNGKTSVRGGFAEVFDLGNIGSAQIQGAIGTPPYSQQATIAAAYAASQIAVTLPLVVHEWPTPTPDNSLYGLAVAPDGNIWSAGWQKGMAVKFDPKTETFTEYKVPNSWGILRRIGVDSKGIVWFGEFNTGILGSLDPASGKISEYNFPTRGSQPYDTWPDKQDNIWISDQPQDSLVRFDQNTKKFTFFPETQLNWSLPKFEVEANNTIWFGARGVAHITANHLYPNGYTADAPPLP